MKTYILILICVLLFILQNIATIEIDDTLALDTSRVFERPWTLATNIFLHGNADHLLFNLLSLFLFGTALEEEVGGKRLLLVFFVSGIVGSVGFVILRDSPAVLLGASGAIYGVIGALLFF